MFSAKCISFLKRKIIRNKAKKKIKKKWNNQKKHQQKPNNKNKKQTLTSDNEHDWTFIKYVNVLYHSRTQKLLLHFFLNIWQKYYQLSILGTLDKSSPFIQKTIMWTCRNLDVYLYPKMNSIDNFFFQIL